MKCENSVLCHLCDGFSHYKNTSEEKAQKREQKEINKQAKKTAILKTHSREKKEGMGFEKRVAGQWNAFMNQERNTNEPLLKVGNKKQKQGKPRLDISDIIESDSNDAQQEKVEQTFTTGIKGLNLTPGSTKGNVKPVPTTPRPQAPKPQYKRQEARRQANSGAMWHSKGDIVLDHALMECKERGTVSARGEKQITIPKEWLVKQEKEAFQEQKEYWYLPFGYKNDDSIYLIKPYDHELELIYELRKAREEIERLQGLLDEKNRP